MSIKIASPISGPAAHGSKRVISSLLVVVVVAAVAVVVVVVIAVVVVVVVTCYLIAISPLRKTMSATPAMGEPKYSLMYSSCMNACARVRAQSSSREIGGGMSSSSAGAYGQSSSSAMQTSSSCECSPVRELVVVAVLS